MTFVLLFGPQAVGKMTVGEELAALTGFRLFHNHMTIEPLYAIFGDAPQTWRLSHAFRQAIFEAAAGSSHLPGLIFTYVWAFDLAADWQYAHDVTAIFETQGWDTVWVELEADLATRLVRNRTPHRLEAKPTKRNVAWSDQEVKMTSDTHRLNSRPGEIQHPHYFRLENTDVSPNAAARAIGRQFGWLND